jgi:uncharacterized protein YndB with AHSA1/START domain/DNA-binding transcriptional ArsR family regulator
MRRMDEDAVFHALAAGRRRALIDRLSASDGQSAAELSAGLGMTRQAAAKHLAVLEDAGLVTTLRRGREKLHFLNAKPLGAIAAGWLARFDRSGPPGDAPMSRSAFAYVIYIRAAPERVWSALTDRAAVARYWFGATLESDWRAGSQWRLSLPDGRVSDLGEVLEADAPKTLVLQWRHALTPQLAAEGEARCAITLEAAGEATKLAIRHEIEAPGSRLIEAVADGWPKILSNLKSLLETGEVALRG